MQRVMIIGAGGAGKSWLGKRLAAATGLPLVHLDREFWRAGWVEPPKAVWAAQVAALTAGDRWILDGNYGGTLPVRMERADTIVFLDVSRWQSVTGVLSRWVRQRGRVRDDVAAGCPEHLSLKFLAWLWAYPEKHRPGILALLGDHAHGRTIHILRDRRAIEAFAQRAAAINSSISVSKP